MSGWIKKEKDLLTDPRIFKAGRALADLYDLMPKDRGPACNAEALPGVTLMMGALDILWMYADTHLRPDDTLDLGPHDVDQLVGIAGFCQICPTDWLEIIDSDCVKLAGFHKHNGTEARKKALTQKRVEAHRNTVKRTSVTARNKNLLPDQDQDLEKTKTKTSLRTTARERASDDDEPEGFAEFRQIFPPRAGSQPWHRARGCWRARVKEGHTPAKIIAGAARYAAFIEATGQKNTRTVLQAATFLGPDTHFENLYPLPAEKESAWDEIQRLNGGPSGDPSRIIDTEPRAAGLVPLLRPVRR